MKLLTYNYFDPCLSGMNVTQSSYVLEVPAYTYTDVPMSDGSGQLCSILLSDSVFTLKLFCLLLHSLGKFSTFLLKLRYPIQSHYALSMFSYLYRVVKGHIEKLFDDLE